MFLVCFWKSTADAKVRLAQDRAARSVSARPGTSSNLPESGEACKSPAAGEGRLVVVVVVITGHGVIENLRSACCRAGPSDSAWRVLRTRPRGDCAADANALIGARREIRSSAPNHTARFIEVVADDVADTSIVSRCRSACDLRAMRPRLPLGPTTWSRLRADTYGPSASDMEMPDGSPSFQADGSEQTTAAPPERVPQVAPSSRRSVRSGLLPLDMTAALSQGPG